MPVTCPYCSKHFPKSDTINSRHKNVCAGWKSQLGDTKPHTCICGHVATSLTQMKRHRKTCEVWKARDKRKTQVERLEKTLQERHGVSRVCDVAGVSERRAATNQERYGAENVFSRESSLFDRVQEGLEGKRPVLRGAANPFSKAEVKAKIREHYQTRYGVDNPQQVPEVRSRTRATNYDRYGSEETLSSPVIRRKIRETCEEKYGGPSPAHSPEVQSRMMETNRDRYGVDWTCQDPLVRQKQLETMESNYGSHFFSSEEGQARIRESLIAKYGVDHPAKIEGHWERAVAAFHERYGAAHPLLLAEFLDKRRDTCMERYGVDSPLRSPEIYAKLVETVRAKYDVYCVFQAPEIQEKAKETNIEKYDSPYYINSDTQKQRNIEKYGFPHPMMNREYARQHLEKMRLPGPNLLERRFGAAVPELVYTGDGSFWRWLPKLGHHKNPDFIVPGPVGSSPKRQVTKVLEVFGDYWHSKMFTGRANFTHEQELVDAFADIGIDCMVVWEGEFNSDPEGVCLRVREWLAKPFINMLE